NREWYQLSYSQLQSTDGLRDLFIDSKGYLWVIKYRDGTGVFCADLNGTPLDEQDDKKVFISTFYDKDSHALTLSTVRCITEDQEGVVWIGTDRGPLLVPDASKMFDPDFRVDRVKITREDNASYADYLLENEQINAIVVDGNNRKWVGTNSTGLYLLSSDGKETIHHFTTDNCPFTSNAIMDLFINNETGQLYIVTSSGLFLYQTDAIKGAESYNKVYAYPNPVKEDYDGPVTIVGLRENSQVRISDSEGRIIHDGVSNGGAYVWDGKDLNGRKVNTGVYFIYAALSDGSSKMVTKIAIIK
ncbi:MAG: Por secretion system protein, partial [Paludibacteraceae bacterium]|nr:Por secretion system protein [Paludibacteraceae bacterium]